MNVYLHELKAHYKGLIGWSVGMFVLLLLSMNKYATYKSAGTSITSLVEKFPHSVQVIFGFNGLDISTAVGYFGTVYLFIVVAAAVYAAMRGADLIAKEERDRTAEFLVPKPVSRDQIVQAKIMAGLTQVGILWLVTVASSYGLMAAYAKGADFTAPLGLMMIATLTVMLVFLFIGTAIAAFVPRPKLAVTLASSVVLAAYIISVLINVAGDLEWLNFITPINYFQAASIIADNTLGSGYFIISFVIVIVAMVLTYVGYRKRNMA